MQSDQQTDQVTNQLGQLTLGELTKIREHAHRPDSHYDLNTESFSELVTSKSRLRETHENRVEMTSRGH
jgi:hypothetical protein